MIKEKKYIYGQTTESTTEYRSWIFKPSCVKSNCQFVKHILINLNIFSCPLLSAALVNVKYFAITMEESVALDSSKQKQFVKSVRGIKKLLKVCLFYNHVNVYINLTFVLLMYSCIDLFFRKTTR